MLDAVVYVDDGITQQPITPKNVAWAKSIPVNEVTEEIFEQAVSEAINAPFKLRE